MLISQLYRVEDLADRRGCDDEARDTLRRERASPILERLDRWLQRTIASEPPASALARACAYALKSTRTPWATRQMGAIHAHCASQSRPLNAVAHLRASGPGLNLIPLGGP